MKSATAKKVLPPPRVRREPPTLAEAVSAAQGLSTELDEQIEIAAGLMDVAPDEVRPLVLSMKVRPAPAGRPAVTSGSGRRVVVVERRRSFVRAG